MYALRAAMCFGVPHHRDPCRHRWIGLAYRARVRKWKGAPGWFRRRPKMTGAYIRKARPAP